MSNTNSVRNLMKPKSEDEILNSLGDLSPINLLLKSCEVGYLDGVKLALKRGVDPSDKSNIAIRWVSYYGHTEIFKLLLKDKRVDPSDDRNESIRWASKNGHIDIVKLLLNDPRVDPSDDNNYAIVWASIKGHTEVVKLLLQDKKVRNKLTDKEIKKYQKQISILNESVRDLMKGKSDEDILKNFGNLTPIELMKKSCSVDYFNGVKIALEKGVDPSYNGNELIKEVSRNGYTDIVELFLQDSRVDPSVDYNVSIIYASMNGHTDVVKLLLQDDRVDPSDSYNLAIRYASMKGHTNVVKLLLQDDRVDPSECDNISIKDASKRGYIDIVELLLDDSRVRSKFLYGELNKYEEQIKGLYESHILRFNDVQNLEFRKGSLEYGDKVKQLIEFLRIYKNQNEDTLIFNINDFEKASKISIEDIKELNDLPTKKSLMNFDIEITDNQIKFTNLQNRKSIHTESFDPSIRGNYQILGIEDFYNKVGSEYRNPHIEDIEKCIKRCISYGFDEFNNTLDLGSGTGEVTNILLNLGYDHINIIGCDPYLYREYINNTNKQCLKYSFSDIQTGALDNYKFDTIICSYALHLAETSILPELLWRLSMISKYLIIISPNNRPEVKEEYGWSLDKYFKIGKSKCKIFISNNL